MPTSAELTDMLTTGSDSDDPVLVVVGKLFPVHVQRFMAVGVLFDEQRAQPTELARAGEELAQAAAEASRLVGDLDALVAAMEWRPRPGARVLTHSVGTLISQIVWLTVIGQAAQVSGATAEWTRLDELLNIYDEVRAALLAGRVRPPTPRTGSGGGGGAS
ncbi:hypothetical protein [Nocardia transvalensis]|uniref:hypothetical protein n=1 Tax=Nocardia transvalensis TaxID=37333 RepID=UPI001895F22A|nr:hypothetical protein [Nocardia transvalensis]MBF6333349.1 hypothetical protein [Nocardia transvalensis]